MKGYIFLFIVLLSTLCSIVRADSGIYGGEIYHLESGRIFVGDMPAKYAKLADNIEKKVIIYDIETGNVINTLIFDKKVSGISVSRSGYLAVVLANYSYAEQGDRRLDAELKILDPKYNEIFSILGVTSEGGIAYFDWNMSGEKIAYLTSVPNLSEGGSYPFSGEGAWVFDVASRKNEKIADFGTAIRWSPYDGQLYIRKYFDSDEFSRIYTFDSVTRSLTETSRKGTNFSSDGKYYSGTLFLGSESYSEKIFKSSTDRYIRGYAEGDILLYELDNNNCFIQQGNNLLTYDTDSFSIYNVEMLERRERGLIRSKSAKILGYSNDVSRLVISDGNGRFHIEDTITGQVIKEFVLSAN